MAITAIQVVKGYYNSMSSPSINTEVSSRLASGWIPCGAPVLTDNYGEVAQLMVRSSGNLTTAYVTVVGASPMAPDNTYDVLGQPLWVESNVYLQAYTKGDQVFGVLPVANGGTGATTANQARTNLGIGTIGTLNSVSLTTNVSDTLPVANGGTGATNATDARANLGVGTIGTLNSFSSATSESGVLPVANGGTGATVTTQARANLGLDRVSQGGSNTDILSANLSNRLRVQDNNTWGSVDVSGTWIPLGVGQGGTGATSVAGAKTSLGVDRVIQGLDYSDFLSANGSNRLRVQNTGTWGSTTGTSWIPLGVGQGGTGATNATDARANLGAAAASDRNIKRDILDYDGEESLSKLAAIRPRTFIFKDDVDNRVRRGVIAQEIATIDSEYVQHAHRTLTDDDGNVLKEEDILILDNNVLLMDAIIAIKVLSDKLKSLEKSS